MNDKIFFIMAILAINILPILIDWFQASGEHWYRPHFILLSLIVAAFFWRWRDL